MYKSIHRPRYSYNGRRGILEDARQGLEAVQEAAKNYSPPRELTPEEVEALMRERK